MSLESQAAFYLVWASVLGAPPVALAIFFAVRRRWRPCAVGSALALLSVFGSAALGLSFVGTLANFVCIAVVYLAYCFLAASCWRIPMKAVRIFALIAAAVPICIGCVVALSPVGIFLLVIITGDYAGAPQHVKQMRTDLTCRVTGWGFAGSASGYVVHLYKSWTSVPFIERAVARITIDQTGNGPRSSDATCSHLLAAYLK